MTVIHNQLKPNAINRVDEWRVVVYKCIINYKIHNMQYNTA